MFACFVIDSTFFVVQPKMIKSHFFFDVTICSFARSYSSYGKETKQKVTNRNNSIANTNSPVIFFSEDKTKLLTF